jgi:putative transposase
MTDRSRRPFRQANQLPMQIETLIVQLKREHPSRGAPKFREKAFPSMAIALVAATRGVRMLQLMPVDDRRSR